MIHVTLHAKRRVRQRLHLPHRAAMRLAAKALEHGLSIAECRGELQFKLLEKVERHGKGANARVWQGHAYIFEGQTLITVFALPAMLRASARKQQRRKHREP